MPDYARVLGLASDAMRSIALAHAGYGIAQQREAQEAEARLKELRDQLDPADARQQLEELGELRMVAASELAIGASLYAIMFPRIARVLFRAAARSYDRLGLEYAVILGLCGRDIETVNRQWGRQRERPRFDDDGGNIPARLLLATERAIDDPEARSETARILEQIARLRGVLIGSAGIPASTYREWAAAMLDIVESKGDAPRQPRALPRLFEAFEERLEAARANEFQWQRVNSALLPVEPEILAAAIAVVRASRRWGAHWERTIGGPLSEVARVPLELAHLMEEDGSPSGEERDLLESSDALRELWRQFAEGH